ncbi:hypothetical protein IAU60_005420 [Kwoniella sp. DSM 27419]
MPISTSPKDRLKGCLKEVGRLVKTSLTSSAKSFVRCLMQPPARRPSANKALQHPWLSDIPAVDQAHVEDSSEANADILHPHPTIKPHHPIAKQLTARPAAD